MSRPLRLEFPGSLWHLTARGNERRPTFHDDGDRTYFLNLLADAVDRFKWIVTAFALMTNHYHVVIELTANTLSRGTQWLNGTYAQWFNRKYGRVGHLFQGRFNACLIDKETYFLEVLRYVVLNPVRAKLVALPHEYPWTSYAATSGQIEPPAWLAVDEVLTLFAPDRRLATEHYRRFVHEGIGGQRPWDNVVGSMYLGPAEWLERVRCRVESKPRPNDHARAQRELLPRDMQDVLIAVSDVMAIPEHRIRRTRGGMPRAIAAWVGSKEAGLTNTAVAAALRLSPGRVTQLVAACDEEALRSASHRAWLDRCVATLRRKS
jgi:putative transposase